ncbi:class II aldolase/adducin family protein [Streptomyces sp. NPDC055006]
MEEVDEIVHTCRHLAAEGLLVGTGGNVSMRTGDSILITGTGVVLAEAVPDDIVRIDLAGQQVDGRVRASSESLLHARVYAGSDAVAVVHTHSPAATAVTLLADELPALHYQQLQLGGSTPVVDFHVFGTSALADAARAAITGRQAVLLAHHGAVAIGRSLTDAAKNASLLEWACGLYLRAAAAGAPRSLSPEQLAGVAEAATARGYGTRQPR